MALLNQTLLMSGTAFFANESPINPYMSGQTAIDREEAAAEHATIKQAFEQAGIVVRHVPPPPHCQDGVYTANWALIRGGTAVLARLPSARAMEEAYARQVLTDLGKRIVTVPGTLRFSGQGDALPCGNLLFAGQTYRSDPEAQIFAAKTLGYQLVLLQTVPATDDKGNPLINKSSGWPDSFFYDIDLALAVIRPDLIAWCPQAFTKESQAVLRACHSVEKIEVSRSEAMQGFACNLVSTGTTVIMSDQAPGLKRKLEARGLKVITPAIRELIKGGGFIRCTSLTLDNKMA